MSNQGGPSGISPAPGRGLPEGHGETVSPRCSRKEGPARGVEVTKRPQLEEMMMQETKSIKTSLLRDPVPTAENLLKLERWYCLYRAIGLKCEELHAHTDDEVPLQAIAEIYKLARYPNPAVEKRYRERRPLSAKEFRVRSRRQLLLFDCAAMTIAEALQCGRNNDRDGFRSIITTKLN